MSFFRMNRRLSSLSGITFAKTRTRRDQLRKRFNGFEAQAIGLTKAYTSRYTALEAKALVLLLRHILRRIRKELWKCKHSIFSVSGKDDLHIQK